MPSERTGFGQHNRCRKKEWNAVEKQLRIDVNKYIAKYDFDVAKKICPMVSGTNYREDL